MQRAMPSIVFVFAVVLFFVAVYKLKKTLGMILHKINQKQICSN